MELKSVILIARLHLLMNLNMLKIWVVYLQPFEIINVRVKHDKTWACHAKPCIGALRYLKEHGLPYHVIDTTLLTESDDWSKYTN